MNTNMAAGLSLRMAVLLVLHVVFGVVALGLLIMYVPEYEPVFKDFGLRLPAITIMALNLSHLVASYYYIFIPCIVIVDVGVLSWLSRAGKTRLLTLWGVLVWLAEMLLVGLIVAAVLLPMNDLANQLSK